MRDYPILHGCKSTVETIQFYMDSKSTCRDYPILHGSKSTSETIQFYIGCKSTRDYPIYMDVNQHERLSNFTWM